MEVAPGEILAEEATALLELKAELTKVPDGQVGRAWLLEEAGDLTYLRFLRGHGLKVKKALKLLKNCAQWRVEYGTADILDSWPANMSKEALLVRKFWPMAVVGKDLAGRPVHYFHLSVIDFASLFRYASIEDVVRHNVYLMEKAFKHNPRGEAIMIVDVGADGSNAAFQLKNAARWIQSVLSFVRAMAKVADPYYPESYFRIYFTRVHAVFQTMLKLPGMAEKTRSKVQILKKEDMLEKLLEDMDISSIPSELGGESKVVVARGGLISPEEFNLVSGEAAKIAAESGTADAEDDAEEAAPAERLSLRKSLSKRLSLRK